MANTEEVKQFESWEEVICQFIKDREERKIVDLLSKKDPKKSFNDEKQAINIQLEQALKNCSDVKNADIEKILSAKNTGENKTPKIRFVLDQYIHLVRLNPELPSIKVIAKLFETRKPKILEEHTPKNWLDTYAKVANGVSFATHISKLTHSSIKGASSFYVQKSPLGNTGYLSTSDLINPVVDSAIDNAAYTPVVSLLKLTHNGKILADILSSNSAQPFRNITLDPEQIREWVNKFKSVLFTDRKASHSLAKQIYFPVKEKEFFYNLLCNVQSSTFAHNVFEITSSKKKEEQNKILQKRKYYSEEICGFYGKAILSITSMDSAKNVSPLHSRRGGKISLFSCQPPTWQSQLKPPVYQKSLFDNLYHANIETEVDYLRDFLLRFNKLDLSIKDPKRKRHLERWVNNIIDKFLFYLGSIQALAAGWTNTEGVKLKPAHQYLLDPYRLDEVFQRARQSTDWQAIIHADFAQWLNYQLRGKDKQFTPKAEHIRLWKKLLSAPLREYMETVELEVKQQRKEAV